MELDQEVVQKVPEMGEDKEKGEHRELELVLKKVEEKETVNSVFKSMEENKNAKYG